jgi:hypothetical protein
MTFNAFTESQAEILKQLASASPIRWEYQVKEWLSICDSIRGIQEVEAYLAEKRTFLMRAQIDLPPRHVLSQYVNLSDGSLMYVRSLDEAAEEAQEMIKADPNRCSGLLHNGILKLGPFRIEGVLGDPVQWVTSAFINVELLLKRLEGLNELCKSERTAIEKSKDRFVLDPPALSSNPIVQALRPFAVKHFKHMSADEVYEVFESGEGILHVRYNLAQEIASVIEAVRVGLSLSPDQVRNVKVVSESGQRQHWINPKNGKNRFYDALRTYTVRKEDDPQGLRQRHDEMISALTKASARMLNS